MAKGNAKKILPLPDDLPPDMLKGIRRLGDTVQKQLKQSLDAFLEKSVNKSLEVIKNDEQVNNMASVSIKEVLDFLSKDKKKSSQQIYFL